MLELVDPLRLQSRLFGVKCPWMDIDDGGVSRVVALANAPADHLIGEHPEITAPGERKVFTRKRNRTHGEFRHAVNFVGETLSSGPTASGMRSGKHACVVDIAFFPQDTQRPSGVFSDGKTGRTVTQDAGSAS